MADMNESTRMNRASERLIKLAGTNSPLGTRINAEQEYAEAYQEMVRQGKRPQIREKYRRR